MTNRLLKFKIDKINQRYLHNILKKYPHISSGRKNYKYQYIRILKNILLIKAYKIILEKKIESFDNKIKFQENKKFLTIKFNI